MRPNNVNIEDNNDDIKYDIDDNTPTNRDDDDNSEFSINGWFNRQTIRIIGTHMEPFFYARDLAEVLGTPNSRAFRVSSLEKMDIVQPETRKALGLITYKKNRTKMVEDDSIVLLTESGAYRVIIRSNSPVARDFQRYVFAALKKKRVSEVEKLQLLANRLALYESEIALIDDYKRQLTEYKKLAPILYVLKRVIDKPVHQIINIKRLDKEMYNAKSYKKGTLYLYTTNPSVQDLTNLTLVCKCCPNIESVFEEIDDEDLDCTKIEENVSEINTSRIVINLYPYDLTSIADLPTVC